MGDVQTLHPPLRSSASHASFFDSSFFHRSSRENSSAFFDLRSQSLRRSQLSSTAVSSLDTRLNDDNDDYEGLAFPVYGMDGKYKKVEDPYAPSSSRIQSTTLPMKMPSPASNQLAISEDDMAVCMSPSHHVDYLSYDWKEEDIWSSWRHIVEHRHVYGERSRLENASWRTWAKMYFKLKTTTPESLNWLKDVDVTWLYGPLQPVSHRFVSWRTSKPTNLLSKPNSLLPEKPVLNKRKKHIRFDENVEQYIAVEVKGAEDHDEEDFNLDNDLSSDDGVEMMRIQREPPLSRTNSKVGMIAKSSSTTLKFRTDSPDIPDQQPIHSQDLWPWGRLSPSPSQETLRPSSPSTSFLVSARPKKEQELLVAKLFGLILAEREDLRTLHKNLLSYLGIARFVENYRKGLKAYVLKLREEAQTAIEQETVEIIENHENRRSMALQIASYAGKEDIDYRKQIDGLALQLLKKQLIEDGERIAYQPPDHPPAAADFSSEESENEAGDGNGFLETNHLKTLISTNLDTARNFLQRDTPLQTLIFRLRILALPPFLREIMETAPKQVIGISDKNDISLMNKCKSFVETFTATQWDWWPLRPPVPDLTPGQLRLEWEFCGETLYADISPQEAILIKQILTAMSEHPPECYCCKVQLVQLDWTTAFQHIRHIFKKNLPIKTVSPSSATLTPSSKAYLRYTPAGTTCPNSSSSLPHEVSPLSPQNIFPSSNVSTQAHIGGTGNNTPANSLWVVFGIKDMRGFHDIENIETHTQLNDPSFFQELKLRHRSHCWRFQRWFSPYRFRYCRFVQFEELLSEHVSCIGEALPDEHGYTKDYEYSPRPPSATIPLIDPIRFSILLSACHSLCYWSLLPAFLHKCRRIPADRRYLNRIPRKKGVYNALSRAQTPNLNSTERTAFGIEAGYLPSFAFFFFYHVIPILSGFSFWIYWMKYHPADLQNASVPLFTIIMFIGTFWGLFGKRMGVH